MILKLRSTIELRYRAYLYKTKKDTGGIAYLNAAIKEGQTVLDIGAHKAGYLYFMIKKVGITGRVFAFEPQSILYNYLNTLKKMLHWNNVTIEHLALSNNTGEATIYIPSNKKSKSSSPGATIVEKIHHTEISTSESVHTDTIDHYCQQHQIEPNFIKIDVEGNELKTLKGGMDTLKKYKPKILIEIEERHVGKETVLETFRFLEALNYQGQIIHGFKKFPLSDFDFDKHQNIHDKKNYCNNFIFE